MQLTNIPLIYASVLASDCHCLIGGTTGSGKSTLINGAIKTLTKQCTKGTDYKLCLIDPKKVELTDYKPFCEYYANDYDSIIDVLGKMRIIMNNRFRYMEKHGLKKFDGSYFYIFVDEFADLMKKEYRKEIFDILSDIARLGRASRVFLVLCTQLPGRTSGLPVELNANLNTRIALNCSAIESKQIVGIKDAEYMDLYGQAIVKQPGKFLQFLAVPDENGKFSE